MAKITRASSLWRSKILRWAEMISAATATAAKQIIAAGANLAARIVAARKARRSKAEAITDVYGPMFIRAGFYQGLRVAAGKAGRQLRKRNWPRGQVDRNTYIFFPEWERLGKQWEPALRAFLDDAAKGNNEQCAALIMSSKFFGRAR